VNEGAGTPRRLEGVREPLGRVTRPTGNDNKDGGVWRPSEERTKQIDGRRVGPVDVVEHQHEGPGGGQPLEEFADGAVAAISLVSE
jgi:hypothetical protein